MARKGSRIKIGRVTSRSMARSCYREFKAQAKAAEKAHQLAVAQSEIEQQAERIEKLTGVLKSRDRGVFDWDGLLNADKDYLPTEFVAEPFNEAAAKKAALKQAKWLRWALGGVLSVLILPGATPVGAIGLLVSIVGLVNANDKRKTALGAIRTQYERRIVAARGEHSNHEVRRKTRAEMAPKLRELQQTEVFEPLLTILEEELSNEELPVPLVFDVEFDDISGARIDLTLPDTDEVPSEKYSITARGKLSVKAMPQKERRQIYASLACGLALRVAHEAFRVIPSLETLEVRGLAEFINPANGKEKSVTALVLPTNRKAFQMLNLDSLDPEAAIEGLGGEFGCSARLELKDVA